MMQMMRGNIENCKGRDLQDNVSYITWRFFYRLYTIQGRISFNLAKVRRGLTLLP